MGVRGNRFERLQYPPSDGIQKWGVESRIQVGRTARQRCSQHEPVPFEPHGHEYPADERQLFPQEDEFFE